MTKPLQLLLAFLLLGTGISFGQDTIAKKDSLATKELPLEPERKISLTTNEGTWISVDVSPDGKNIIFDMMGNLYRMPLTGGKAENITSGMAYDVHPRYSPNGKEIVFISDRSGADNIWLMDLETKETTQITEDDNQNYFSASWSPDGEYIVGAKGRRNIKLHLYHREGGKGAQLLDKPDNLKAIDPAFSHDGKSIYYSKRSGAWNYNAQLPQYQIGSYDMETGETTDVTARYGSAFTPVLSPNGKWLVYGTRFEDQTGLVRRELATGREEWLAYPIQRDDQESIASLGVLPAMSFTPNSDHLITYYGGKIHKINVETKQASEIPFEVDLDLHMGPEVIFKYPIKDDPTARVTQIRNAVPSPDGSKLAFTALNRLYVMDFPNGEPRRLTKHDFTEAHPAWSPDGSRIVFTTWQEEGGHLYSVNANGRNLKRLTSQSAIYSQPAYSYNSDRIAFLRGTAETYRNSFSGFGSRSREDLAWIPAEGGEVTIIERYKGRTNPHFTKVDDRVYLNDDEKLISIRWDGTDEKELLKVKGITPFGSSVHDHDHDHAALTQQNGAENDKASKPSIILISPDGKKALAKINNDIYSVTIPRFGKTPEISVANVDKAAFPASQVTEIGGEFPAWSGNSKNAHWSLGASHFVYDLAAAKVHNDSLKAAKKLKAEAEGKDASDDEEEGDEDEKENGDEEEDSEEEEITPKDEDSFKADEFEINITYQRALPQGAAVIKNARILTMKGDEIIQNGDILIKNNRIEAVGPAGSLDVPRGATEIDASGKTVMPGFIDTHAHLRPNAEIHKNQVWMYAANLAYGVTTTRDPQTGTTDVLTYADMVEAGMLAGPRIYSTGPGLGYWGYKLKDLDHTRRVLKQYSKYYDTKSIKMYLVGNRQMRQWVIQASKELELMPTTEGGLDFKLNMTQLLDGYPGHEHSFPVYPVYKDVIQTVAESKMAVTPTLLVSYGGPWAEEYYYATEQPYNDQKLQRFTPYEELARKSRRRGAWFMEEEHVFQKHAAMMKDLIDANGLVGVGSHGQLQGLGYHWELWALQSGGMDEHTALRAATILGAESLGLDGDLGTVEAGKLADLVILDGNPLENIRNSNTVRYVIKDGRIYNAESLDELHPEKKPAKESNWQTVQPENLPGIRE
ncbi:amidohydrolase family protein [Antarcticibacterium flavum]|uniref:Amidohydrolase family protein n=1 Tax=Antarcticibacterium flavum TaxID=2058175 RepID=A0A5B7X3X5_9FLAO|nr:MULTISPECIES: amidohydrolase family protein [Antarcticibacterium]MCM4161331.1 amidohydrolase [Antarcticibacterium sp. W02-3]QCY69411.1 amidohydrolase family protein [Antarcticibacterium flavum]